GFITLTKKVKMFIYKVKFKSIINTVKNYKTSDWLKILVGLLIGTCFLIGLYFGFWRFLVQVQALPLIGTILLNKFLAIAFLTTFIMVIFSSIIVSFSTIFFAEDNNFLSPLPLRPSSVFMAKTFESAIQSSWMMVVTLIPFLLAYARVRNAGLEFFAAFGLISIPFLFIAASVGVFISLLTLYLFPSSKVRDIILVVAIVIGSSLYVLFRFLEPEKLANPDAFYDAMQYIAYLNAPVAEFLPSWWFSECLAAVVSSNTTAFINNTLMILISSTLTFIALFFVSEKIYYTALNNIQAGRTGAGWKLQKTTSINFLSKDIRVFFRDTRQWSQLMLVAALVLVYLFSLYKVPQSFSGRGYPVKYITNFLAYLNVGAAGFILAALALRFVFPQVSLEARTLWLVLGSPVSLKKFFLNKMVFTGVPMILIAMLIGVSSNLVLGVSSAGVFILTAVTIVIISFGLLCLATGLGAAYPRFDTDNIARIEISYGGLLFTLSSLFYVGLILATELSPVQMFIRQEMGGKIEPLYYIFNAVDFLLINAAAILVPVYLGMNSLKKIELREWIC
ncbi:MAG: hypothetical protein AB1633_05435, partial [Elusimicrobiota bacterium]